MRLLAAFVWLHWRQEWNALTNPRRSRASRLMAGSQVVVRIVLILLFVTLAAAAAAAAFVGGGALLEEPSRREPALAVLRIVTGSVSVLALLLPVLRAGFGSFPSTERLLLLPVSRRSLHALEATTYLFDPWLVLFLPALIALAVPALTTEPVGATLGMVAGLAFLAALGTMAGALTFGIRIVLRDRRRAEAAALVLFLTLMALSFLPALVDQRLGREQETHAAQPTLEVAAAAAPGGAHEERPFEGVDRFPWALQALPSEAYTRIVARASAGAVGPAVLSLVPLGGITAMAWLLSGALWRRLVGSPDTSSRRRAERTLPGWRRVPGVQPATLAVAGTLVRTTLRTVQGKIVAVIPTIVIVLLSVLSEAEAGPWGTLFGSPSIVLAAAFFAVSGLQNVLLNLFGVDGGGLSLQLLMPLSARQIVRGKALGGVLLLSMIMLPALAVAVLLGEGVSPWLAPAGFLASLGTYLLFFPLATALSILFPKAANLAKLGREGKPHPAAALLGFLSLLVLLLPPGLAGFTGLVLAGAGGALAAEALFAALAAILFVVFSASAAALFELRREGLYLAVREG
jgi:hypothetical protein